MAWLLGEEAAARRKVREASPEEGELHRKDRGEESLFGGEKKDSLNPTAGTDFPLA